MEKPTTTGQILNQADFGGKKVVTFGGANIERAYTLGPGEFQADAKFSKEPRDLLAGGSAVNHTSRLLAMGVDVYPVLPVVHPSLDHTTGIIRQSLNDAAASGKARILCEDEDLFVSKCGLTNSFSTIVCQGSQRAILNEFSMKLIGAFPVHCKTHRGKFGARKEAGVPDVVMVGHIHADRKDTAEQRRLSNNKEIGQEGRITEEILTHRSFQKSKKYVNFGASQYSLGKDRWEEVIKNHVDMFQLDIHEIRRFCRGGGRRPWPVKKILKWFRSRCTVIITFERFGAVGQLEGSSQAVVAWPIELREIKDTTGAGDAMGAGIVASNLATPFDDNEDSLRVQNEKFRQALEFGRLCGAYACTTSGGSADCPTRKRLLEFEKNHTAYRGEAHGITEHDLWLLDMAFSHG